ncbi:hypothetical protein LANSK_19620 [Lactobacillus amylovorus subsp. amylovorus]|jgi:hypothetical protein
MVRNFKIYEADEFQLTEELTQLAKTKTGRQRQIHYNPNWQYLKEKAKETLQSEEGKRIYGCRKSDVEPIFGHMKSVFGMLRTHLRGKKKVRNHVYDDESEKIWSQQEGKAFDFSFQKQKTR